ncbi:MAG: histidine kinase N-terminal 7TM domain-containing protein [Acutalibacteraceae bacterium]
MIKLKKNTLRIAVTVTLLVLTAYVFRLIGGFHFGLARSLIYIGLGCAWGVSVNSRIIQSSVRRCMTAIALLMVFWFTARTAKYIFVSPEANPDLTRYLWYLYYIPMIFIPSLAAIVSLYIREPENYRPPKAVSLIYIIPAVLSIMVITNDLHQLVFTFPPDAEVWSDKNNGYFIGHYIIIAWIFLCTLIMLIAMGTKCRLPGGKKRILLPCAPIVFLIIYTVIYNWRLEWLYYFSNDLTAVMCLMYGLTLEMFIQCGFIQVNTNYLELFDASTVGVQITDNDYNVFLSSKTAKLVSKDILRQTQSGPVMLESGIRLSGAPIRRGRVIWSEDMSALINVLDELKEAKENLEDGNAILKEENALKARELHIAEQDRLYNIIQRDTARQISLMDELICAVEQSDDEESRVRTVKKMLVIGAYLKRRSNLVFLADKTPELDVKELALTLGESMNNLEMCGIACGFKTQLSGTLPAADITAMYDFFEEITERSLDYMSTLTAVAAEADGKVCLIINTDSTADLSALVSENITAKKDDDSEWQVVLSFDSGGERNESTQKDCR